jgi:hypothetical protein
MALLFVFMHPGAGGHGGPKGARRLILGYTYGTTESPAAALATGHRTQKRRSSSTGPTLWLVMRMRPLVFIQVKHIYRYNIILHLQYSMLCPLCVCVVKREAAQVQYPQ